MADATRGPVVSTISQPLIEVAADVLILGVFESSESALSEAVAQVDQACGGLITSAVEYGEFTGKPLQLFSLWGPSGLKCRQVLLVGLGAAEKLSRQTVYRAASAAARQCAGRPRQDVVFAFPSACTAELLEAAVAGSLVGGQGQDLFRAERKRHPAARIQWSTAESEVIQRGAVLGESINWARYLVNLPPEDLYPERFADLTTEMAAECHLNVEVWDAARLEQERAGSLLAVARGSSRPPRLVQLRYAGGLADAPWLALVGKGVTFDSGGLSLKTSEGMITMKCDMAGAATVTAAMAAIARLKLPVNVMALVGLVENMPSGNCMKLGDVLRARNGKTIEVMNTDAEGRLVLADVLDVAVEAGADRIVDLATLTGACMVALGTDVAGVMTNDAPWGEAVLAAANVAGDPAWQLPMFPEYGEQIRSEVADIKNTGNGRWGGAITAAKFLEEFVSNTPWVHIDIAGPAFNDTAKPWIDGGASGCFVQTLVQVARDFPQKR